MIAKWPNDRLPLHVALAWMFCSDDAFMFEVMRYSYRPLAHVTQLFELQTREAVVTREVDEDAAWLHLRDAIGTGLVTAWGSPFDRKFFDPANPAKYISYEDEYDDDPIASSDVTNQEPGIEPEQQLGAETVSTLQLERSPGWLFLRSKTFSAERWWCNVSVAKPQFLENFPFQKSAKPPRDQKRIGAREAVKALGVTVASDRTLYDINEWLKKHKADEIKLKTLQRAVKDVNTNDH